MTFSYLKKIILAIIVPAFLISMKPDKGADFSGNWTLNESKSEMGQYANIVPIKIKVVQKTDSIAVTKTSKSFDGNSENNDQETLSYDGKEVKNAVQPGSSTRKASAKWSDDKQTLTVTYVLSLDFNGQNTEVKGTEIWKMNDEKTLVVTNTSSSSFGDNTYKGVYQKQ